MNRLFISLLLVSSVFAGALLTNISVSESGYEYTFDVSIDDSKYVMDFVGVDTYMYYEDLTLSTTGAGQFTFTDNGSSLSGGTINTAVLIYNNPQANLIIDEPWAFYNSESFYFGGGQESVRNISIDGTTLDDTPFYTTLALDANTEYTAVFTAFQNDVLGNINVVIDAPSQLIGASIPEPRDTGMTIALIVATFVAFSYFYTKLKL